MTIARIDATVMRHNGASTASNSGPSGYDASVGKRAAHWR
jgi:hypothetical protein